MAPTTLISCCVTSFHLRDHFHSTGCISKYSSGCIYYFQDYHTTKNQPVADKLEHEFRFVCFCPLSYHYLKNACEHFTVSSNYHCGIINVTVREIARKCHLSASKYFWYSGFD